MTGPQPLLMTPLHDTHLAWGAKLVDFAGWHMPVSFSGIVEEHLHTRSACSLFDVSHMGRLRLTGPDAAPLLEHLCTRNLESAEVGRCYYSHICRDDGGILDDVIVYRMESDWLVVCNASNRTRIVGWIESRGRGMNVRLVDETSTTAMIALQGPRTLEVAEQVAHIDLRTLGRYRFQTHVVTMLRLIVSRTGYTGEDGLEVILPATAVPLFLPRILGTPDQPHSVVRPAGLGARDTLRLEAAMPLYGHELGEEVDSLTAGQAWCVDLKKNFIGAEALRTLRDRGLARKLVGLELDGRRIARQNAGVYVDQRPVGRVTSGTLSPTLGKSIAMAYLESGVAGHDGGVEVEVSGKRLSARVVNLPFYRRSSPKG